MKRIILTITALLMMGGVYFGDFTKVDDFSSYDKPMWGFVIPFTGYKVLYSVAWAAGYHATGLTSTDNRSSFATGYNWLAWDGIDFSSYGGGKWFVRLTDSSGNVAEGYSGGAGTGETLGSELVGAWTNNGTYPYETFASDGSSVTSAINTTLYGICYSAITATIGYLYKATISYILNSGSIPTFYWASSVNGGSPRITPDFNKPGTSYRIANAVYSHLAWYTSNGVATDFSSLNSLKQVLTPPTSGLYILDGPSGSSGWSKIDSSFDYNAIVEIEINPAATMTGVSISGVSVN